MVLEIAREELREWGMARIGLLAAREMAGTANVNIPKSVLIDQLLDSGQLLESWTIEQRALTKPELCGAHPPGMPHWKCTVKAELAHDVHRRGKSTWKNSAAR